MYVRRPLFSQFLEPTQHIWVQCIITVTLPNMSIIMVEVLIMQIV